MNAHALVSCRYAARARARSFFTESPCLLLRSAATPLPSSLRRPSRRPRSRTRTSRRAIRRRRGGAAAPAAVTIDFTEPLEPAFSSIVVVDGDGKTVSDGRARIDASNRKRMSVPLTAVGTGAYTVKWVAVATDGHRTQGAYGFSVK